jgi:sodium/potassium/calcium exchanger 6
LTRKTSDSPPSLGSEIDTENIVSISGGDGEDDDEEESDEQLGIRLSKLPFKENISERIKMEMEKFRGETLLNKIQYVVMAPFALLMNLTIPMAAPWNPLFGLLSPFFVSLMVLILSPWADDPFDGFDQSFLALPLPLLFLLGSAAVSGLIYFTTIHYSRVPRFQLPYMIVGFLMCVFWIFTVANELVSILHTWGLILNISEAILGLTVLAWGNCIGDMVSDVVIAKQGLPGMAIAACFGGPLFNILVGLGVSLTWACIRNGMAYDLFLNDIMVIAFIFLGIGLLSTLIVVPLNGFVFSRNFALYLFGLYFLMTATNLLNMTGVIDINKLNS